VTAYFTNLTMNYGTQQAIVNSGYSNVYVTSCTFRGFGTNAIAFSGGKLEITKSNIDAIGQTAITFSGSNLIVEYSSITNFARYEWFENGAITTPDPVFLYNNYFSVGPFAHLYLYEAYGSIIEWNVFTNSGAAAGDIGLIYFNGNGVLSPIAATTISNNYFANCQGSTFWNPEGDGSCLYLDDAESYVTVTSNIFYTGTRAILNNGGQFNTFKDNIMMNMDYECAVATANPSTPTGTSFTNNMYAACKDANVDVSGLSSVTVNDNTYVPQSSDFVNAAAGNFALSEYSGILSATPGFPDPQFGNMGIPSTLVAGVTAGALPASTTTIVPPPRAPPHLASLSMKRDRPMGSMKLNRFSPAFNQI